MGDIVYLRIIGEKQGDISSGCGTYTLNDGLIKYPETILFTSHDHQFVETVADRIIDVTPGHFFDEAITFDEYVEKTSEQNDKK